MKYRHQKNNLSWEIKPMKTYQASLVIDNSKRIVLSDLPFQQGQEVEVIIIAKEKNKQELANQLKEFFKEVQALHAEQPMTEEEIQQEIEAYRRGE